MKNPPNIEGNPEGSFFLFFVISLLYDLHPWNQHNIGKSPFPIGDTSSNTGFPIAMLVDPGVYVFFVGHFLNRFSTFLKVEWKQVEYEKCDPELHCELFCKYPHLEHVMVHLDVPGS